MSIDDEEGAFASLFSTARQTVTKKAPKQRTAERHASLTEKAHARLGRERPVQINFRSTQDFKTLAAGLAKCMDISTSEMIERAVEALAKQQGYPRSKKNAP